MSEPAVRRLVAALLAAFVPAMVGSAALAQVRVITGPGISPPPPTTGPLLRIEPPAPPPRSPAPIVQRRLVPVMAESAVEIRSGRIRVRLPGIEAVDPQALCRDDDGVEWRCGRRARAAVSAMLRLNAVACPLPSDARLGDFTLACTLGRADLAERIVAAGWARATADGPYGEAEAAARRDRRGLWGRAPGPLTETTRPTDTLPPDPTLAPLLGGGE